MTPKPPKYPYEFALEAVQRKWWVYPLAGGTKVPPSGTDGQKSATLSSGQVMKWLQLYGADMNYGIDTDRSNLVIIDIDTPKTEAEEAMTFGEAAWSQLLTRYGIKSFDPGMEVWTPSGGSHIYYKANKKLPIRTGTSKLAPGIDVRATNGTIVGPGSIIDYRGQKDPTRHGQYEIHTAGEPKSLPSWLRTALGRSGLAITEVERAAVKPPQPIRISNRDRYATSAFEGEVKNLRATPIGVGVRNANLNTAAFKLRKYCEAGQLDVKEVADALFLISTNELSMNEQEAIQTIKSGLGLK